MNEKPLVSIIVRTVNRPLLLREALCSIAYQDYPEVEAIIVNDGGPPIEDFLRKQNLPIRYLLKELPYSHGRCLAGNIGLGLARGRYIGFLDDDDAIYPYHVSTLVEAIQKSGKKVAYSDAIRATQKPKPFDKNSYATVNLSLSYSRDFDFQALLRDNYIPILAVLFDRFCLNKGINFDPALEVLEDWDFWIQLGTHFPFVHIAEITAEYTARLDGSNTVGQLDYLWEWAREYVKKKHFSKRDTDVEVRI